ncbi:unnamed protein product [Bathycoccus prasinos]
MPRLKTTCTHTTNLGIQNALNHTTTKETTTNKDKKKLVGYRFYVNEKATFRDGKIAIDPEEIIDAIRGEGGTIVKSVKGKVAHDVIVVIDTKSSENVGSTFVSVKDLLDFLLSDDKEATFEVKVIRDDADANKENEKALANKSFCCTGSFQTLGTNRKSAKEAVHRYIRENGGTVTAKVTLKTEFLIVDQFGGPSYVKAARKVGACIVTIENVEKYAKTKDEKFLESDEKLADEILGKDEKKKVASLKRKVNASNLDDDLAADDDEDDDDEDDDDDNDDDYNDEEDDDEEEDDDYNDDDSNAFENTDAMDEDNDDEFDDNDDLAAAAAEERCGMEKLGMKFQTTDFSSKKLSSNGRSSKTPAKATTPRRSSRATKLTTTSLGKQPKKGEEQPCAGGENCQNDGIIKKGETRYLANDTKGVFCGPIENRIVDSNNLVRYLCGRCARPETPCTRCGKLLPAGNRQRAADREKEGRWKCLEGYCQNAAGKETAEKKWPETPCTQCGKLLPAGDRSRAADREKVGRWRCKEGFCQNAAGKETAEKKWPETPCTQCGKLLPAGNRHRAADREKKGHWKCPEGYCQNAAGKETAEKKWPETPCTQCGKLLPAGNRHRAADREKKGHWKCPEGYCQNAAGKETAEKKWPETPCTQCGKLLPAGDRSRAADREKVGRWRCKEGFCQNAAGKETAKKKWPESTCTQCGKLLPAGDHQRAADREKKGRWRCKEGFCQNAAGKETAKKKWPETTCTQCGKHLPAGDHHRAADREKVGRWRCIEGFCQNDAGKEAAKKKWPESTCTLCGKILPAGNRHRAADREKEGRRWKCPKGRGCGGKK